MTSPIEGSDIEKRAEDYVDHRLDRISAGSLPIWDAHDKLLRALVMLSTGVLALTGSVSQLQTVSLQYVMLLRLGWALLGVTILLAALGHQWATKARRFHDQIEHERSERLQQIGSLDGANDWRGRQLRIDAWILDVWDKVDVDARIHQHILEAALWAFVIAMFLLVGFAVGNV